MKTHRFSLIASATSIAMFGTIAHGATVYVDFGTGTTFPSNTDTNGRTWNSVGASGATSLNDSTGAATTIDVSITALAFAGFGNFDGAAGPDPFDESGVFGDALFNGVTTPMQINFSGLAASTQYIFTAINLRGTNGRNGLFTLGDGVAVAPGTSSDIGSGLVLQLNGPILSFNVTSSATGTIGLGYGEQSDGAGGALLNGLTITAVPEPSSAALLGLGALALLRRRRTA